MYPRALTRTIVITMTICATACDALAQAKPPAAVAIDAAPEKWVPTQSVAFVVADDSQQLGRDRLGGSAFRIEVDDLVPFAVVAK